MDENIVGTEPLFYRNHHAGSCADFFVSSLGIHERMDMGTIHHGGPGYPFLFMFFHDQAWQNPGTDDQQDASRGVIIWRAGEEHHYGNPGQCWDHSWMIAGGDAITYAVSEHRFPLNTLLHLDVEGVFVRYLTLIYGELRKHDHQDSYMLRGLLGLWIYELARAHRSGKSPVPRNIQAAEEYMQRHFSRTLALEEIAGVASLSVPRFIARFKEFYGVPPVRHLINVRLERAAQLLAYRQLPIKEVAQKVGFQDQLYFSRRFRARFGTSPRTFREQL